MKRTLMFAVAMAVVSGGVSLAAQGPPPKPSSGPTVVAPTRVVLPTKVDQSPALRDIPTVHLEAATSIRVMPEHEWVREPAAGVRPSVDPVVQTSTPGPRAPAPLRRFEGINNLQGYLPPDTNGDVGPQHYVQTVNIMMAVFSKTTGTMLYGPAPINTLWAGFGGPCEATNNGDPVVLYDRAADRWLISQFSFPNGSTVGPYYQCLAVSQSGDPTGSYYRYAYKMSDTKLNDYPHLGVWPDGYYMSFNQFVWSGFFWSWGGAGAAAFERAKLLTGDPGAGMLYFDLHAVDAALGGMLPTTVIGATAPPEGAPNYFMHFDDNYWGYPQDQLEIWQFHADWATPANSTFSGPTILATAPFNSNIAREVPQPGTAQRLDLLNDRLMHSLPYRNRGAFASVLTNHTVKASLNRAGIRWYEIRIPTSGSSAPTIFQQGTYAPGASLWRWMGSLSMDHAGNIALGYSASSAKSYPSIRYAARPATATTKGRLSGELVMKAGGGSQTHPAGRWGDYSMMSIDPADDCTFWFTTEYLALMGTPGNEAPWRTRIGAFKFPTCTPVVAPEGGAGTAGGPGAGSR